MNGLSILTRAAHRSNLSVLPPPHLEDRDADDSDHRLRDGDGPEDPARPHSHGLGQQDGQWNLEQPIAEEVDDRRRHGVASPVERLHHDHPEGIEKIPVADDPETLDAHAEHFRVWREDTDDGPAEEQEHDRNRSQKDHVVATGDPRRSLGPVGLASAEILPYQGGAAYPTACCAVCSKARLCEADTNLQRSCNQTHRLPENTPAMLAIAGHVAIVSTS